MKDKVKIAVDAMGGENSPKKIIFYGTFDLSQRFARAAPKSRNSEWKLLPVSPFGSTQNESWRTRSCIDFGRYEKSLLTRSFAL